VRSTRRRLSACAGSLAARVDRGREGGEAVEGGAMSAKKRALAAVVVVEVGSDLVDVAAGLWTDDQGEAHARLRCFFARSRRCLRDRRGAVSTSLRQSLPGPEASPSLSSASTCAMASRCRSRRTSSRRYSLVSCRRRGAAPSRRAASAARAEGKVHGGDLGSFIRSEDTTQSETGQKLRINCERRLAQLFADDPLRPLSTPLADASAGRRAH